MRPMPSMLLLAGFLLTCATTGPAQAETTLDTYYVHEAVVDQYGVIAPWYAQQNGQCDWRVRIAAETLKRYPWTTKDKAIAELPEYVFSGAWHISPTGTITNPEFSDWANGDFSQRAGYLLAGFMDYYRYTGDAAAFLGIETVANGLLDYALTPKDHPWPGMLVSVPNRGKPYGQANPRGWIQLDIVAEVGTYLVQAAQMTGNTRWMDAARHWGDLLAERRNTEPGVPPWPRYANPREVDWSDEMTGGVVFLLDFFDTLIQTGYTGKNNSIIKAREAGIAYLRDELLANWLVHDVWGRNYWDWPCNVQVENVTEFVVRYLMEHPNEFPNWQADARDILMLFINRTTTNGGSGADTFNGAWAYPESSGCCGRSLWYGPLEMANNFGQYAALTGSEWAHEVGRRTMILATYDATETGVVIDGIDGTPIVAADWFKIAGPMALKHTLAAMAWMPEVLGASRENHIMRSTAVIRSVTYGDGRIAYETADAPAETVDVLRLAFAPEQVTANGAPLPRRDDLAENGYRLASLPDGDCLVTIRHDGAKTVVVTGDDPQEVRDDAKLLLTGGGWERESHEADYQGGIAINDAKDAAMTCRFTGNQVRLVGRFAPDGGQADVYLDGAKQLVGIDAWNPVVRHQQVLYYANGLKPGEHELKVVLTGKGNPLADGAKLYIDAVQTSAAQPAEGKVRFGEGGGPTGVQRFICGYPHRTDYVDTHNHTWRPMIEYVIRAGGLVDSVGASWYTERTRQKIVGTADPELYRYGIHGKSFWTNITVGPGTYYVRLKLAEHRAMEPRLRAMNIAINGQTVVEELDIAATAAAFADANNLRAGQAYPINHGRARAVDLVFEGIKPKNGIIEIRFTGSYGGEAIVQAIEVGPGSGGEGAEPVRAAIPQIQRSETNLLINGDFEIKPTGATGRLGQTAAGNGWHYLFASPTTCYIWPESDYSIHPNLGLPSVHGGAEAIRTHTDGRGHTLIYQEVAVLPQTKYRASVQVEAVDLHGKGFGQSPGDSALLIVQEIAGDGRITADHESSALTDAGEYRPLTVTFTTGEDTARVRFILETRIAGHYEQGHVTYDDALLERAE